MISTKLAIKLITMGKKAYSIDEQVQLLSNRGMTFDNIPKAKEILADIGYYRLGFFSFPFEKSYPRKINRTHDIIPGTTFKQVHDLYVFDSQLRFILTKALTRIEINIRTRITYMGSMHYINDPWWFCNPSYVKAGYLNKFDKEVYNSVKKNPAIQEHHKKYYKDKYAPAWKTMEFMTLGNIVFLYEAIIDQNLKKDIALSYGCSIGVFLNYLETIRLVRNRCAHGSCLYDLKIDKGINKIPANVEIADAHKIKGAVKVILYFLGTISIRHQNEILKEIQTELSKLSQNPKTQQIVKTCSNFETDFTL